jgi:hypothetical protein
MARGFLSGKGVSWALRAGDERLGSAPVFGSSRSASRSVTSNARWPSALPFLFGNRRAAFYSITARRSRHPDEFKGAIHLVVVDRVALAGARDAHERIDAGGLGGKIVLLPWDTQDDKTRPKSSM